MAVNKIVCVYHGGCIDGFTAAWCVFRGLDDSAGHRLRFVAGEYQEPPPRVDPDEVVICVDFSYKREVMIELARACAGVLILDHHATAIEDLKQDLDRIIDWSAWGFTDFLHQAEEDSMTNDGGRVYTIFDNERSGAGIAWDVFHGGDRPIIVLQVEDRDLWRFKITGSKRVHAVLASHEQTFANWTSLARQLDDTDGYDALLIEGRAIMRSHMRRLEELLPLVARPMEFQTPWGAFTVPVANLPYIYASEAGHMLLEDRDVNGRSNRDPKCQGVRSHRFSATYYDAPLYRVFSLRSRKGGFDVGAVASKYGGGGHQASAGFRVPRGDDPTEFENIVYSTWELMQ